MEEATDTYSDFVIILESPDQLSDPAVQKRIAKARENADRLAQYDKAVELLQQELASVTKKLEDYKASNSMRKATAQQLLARKLSIVQTLSSLGVEL